MSVSTLSKITFFIIISLAAIACGGERVTKTCYVQLLDAPAEVNVYLQKNLYKDEHFVELDRTGTIVPRSHKGEGEVDGDAPFVFFKPHLNDNMTSGGTDNYRFDVKFLYDTLGMMQSMNVHIERFEKEHWHSYANPGLFDLQLDKKQSRLSEKQQRKAVLEKIARNIKTCAFK